MHPISPDRLRSALEVWAPHAASDWHLRLLAPRAGAERQLLDIEIADRGRNELSPRIRLPATAPVALPTTGEVLARLPDGRPAIVRQGTDLYCSFDPLVAISDLLHESWRPRARPWFRHIPAFYQRVPGSLRLRIHGCMLRSEVGLTAAFPSWPREPAADTLVALLLAAESDARGDPGSLRRFFWPAGKRMALVVMHDLDTAASARAFATMVELDAHAGVRSCFNIVGQNIEVYQSLFADARSAGHEIGLHGTRHDLRLVFRSSEKIRRELAAFAPALRAFGIAGFRAPWLWTSPDLDAALAERFLWSSSTVDVDVAPMALGTRGVTTVFPYHKGSLLEIPQTLPMDDRLWLLARRGIDPEALVDAKMAAIRAVGGVAVLGTHLDPHLTGHPAGRRRYTDRLKRLLAADDVWQALPSELANAARPPDRPGAPTRVTAASW